MPAGPLLLELRGIEKSFGGVRALRGVNFGVAAGEIHALVGENGAGKSTLIKILGGVHLPDAGEIWIDGSRASIRGVADARAAGVRIIHQELSLAPNLSVADNLFLGREPTRAGWLRRQRMLADARRLLAELGFHELADPSIPVERLRAAQRQLVEIARAWAGRARILVLDEPTTSLTAADAENLFDRLRGLREQGVGVLYITHRIDEVRRLADRVSVLRDGQSAGTQTREAFDERMLVRWMVGRDLSTYFHRPKSAPGPVVLDARDLLNPRVRGVSFTLRRGEILGVAGLVGSGRSELARAIFGVDRLDAGAVLLDGAALDARTPSAALAAGVVLIPEDRKTEGLVMTQSVGFNAALVHLEEWIRFGWPRFRRRRSIIERVLARFAVRGSISDPISVLSGGNQQKVLVGRWLERQPRVLMLDEPTRGVDVGAREEIFRAIAALAEGGMAVLLISSDLEEILGLAHRIVLYRDGRIVGEGPAEEWSMESLLAKLTGAAA